MLSDIGEPVAGEPHGRFDGEGLARWLRHVE